MAGKFLALTLEEARDSENLGYEFIRNHQDRLVNVDYEFGSIDFGLMSPTRFILNDVCYQIARQYIGLGSDNSDRILIGTPVISASENPKLITEPKIYAKPYYFRDMDIVESGGGGDNPGTTTPDEGDDSTPQPPTESDTNDTV